MKNIKKRLEGIAIRAFKVKKRGDKQIFVELGLAVVGIALVLIFQKELSTIVGDITKAVSGRISGIFTP